MSRIRPGRTLVFVACSCLFTTVALHGVEVEEGVVYATRADKELALDIALPGGGGSLRPAVLFIHGGGWRSGNRQAYAAAIRAFAEQGYVAATASYRLSQEASWPAQLEDVRDALGWLRENAATYGIDPERIGATGASAGGHLSLMLGLLPEEKERQLVRAVVNYFGPTALAEEADFDPEVYRLVEALAGGPLSEKEELIRDLSPVEHVSRTDAPVLTFHGTEDAIVPFKQAERLHEALGKAQVPHGLVVLEKRGHGWGGSELMRTARRTVAFFDHYLRPSEDPLLVADDFTKGAERWEPTDESAWEVRSGDGDPYYALVKKRSDYDPPVRSPLNIALLRDVSVGDFVLEVDLRSTHEPYGHQDLCLFFGYQDPSQFYYVHLGRNADAHANSVFLVDGAPRVSIATERTEGTDWSRGWHRARVRRDARSGRIEVFFDDMSEPAMIAEDWSFAWGRVGVGSFDDTGDFDAFRLWGEERKEESSPRGDESQ